ncbi:hypothetical protein OB2597_04550 [Pseudooceanicola batsensis HTCC2597]|uniref:Phage tail assembly chaperone n=1 Tax=Pseudooceanicola batsensis (strain ATCC BAA-863 / DSM 15984 / KCTC 12145 / HTCC2597) TaxID=252305 RepID=A3U3P2_PSEBH|nr:rcc01693 family protein [Pseudooceanicola batsensis]EAQ01244.1 hypothetical protein OB2597_04550 [Pseudooceanicola batsensis HTCC2597]
MTGFDWPALLRTGVKGLGLRPAEFWALTPAELRLMLGDAAPAPLRRARLDELLAAYPDGEGGGNDRGI